LSAAPLATPKQAADAERVARMAADAFRREFGEGEAEAAAEAAAQVLIGGAMLI